MLREVLGSPLPLIYQAQGQVALRDLGAFNELLKKAGQPGDLRGSLSVDFSGKGDTQNPTGELRVSGDGIKYRGLPIQRLEIETKLENWVAST